MKSAIFSKERLSDFVERRTAANLANGYVMKSTPEVAKDWQRVGLSSTREYYVELTKGNQTVAWQAATSDGKSQLIKAIKG